MANSRGGLRLRNYIYFGQKLIDSYFSQIQLLGKPAKARKLNLSISLTGPKVEISEENKVSQPSTVEMINKIENFLEENADLDRARPQELVHDGHDLEAPRFVLEKFTARKVIVPCKGLDFLAGVDNFVVWISDPDPAIYVEEDYVWRGTFLYLVEGWHDHTKYHSTFSGCSALQFIMNIADGRKALEIGYGEPLGRGSDLHPIDKLTRLGAKSSGQRTILSLYRKRYVTNEQSYKYAGQERRVNDLVGYPLFIAEA